MTKGTGQKHYQVRDHEHAAHQTEAERHQDHDAIDKSRPVGKSHTERSGRPAENRPRGPRRGQ